jgi:hemoglobin
MSERKNPYEIIGGAAKVEELVDRFYDLMALEEPFAELRAMHSEDLSSSRDKLKLFLSGWLGGPDVYSP